MEKFKELGLSEQTLKALEKKGFEEPTPIQELTIPLLLKKELDIVGQAQTGTGKTAAFGLPLIEKLDEDNNHVQALILTPTRELAIQVSEEINSFKGNKRLSVVPVYGGQSIEVQLKRLKKKAHIVVGTPGRIIDHIRRKTLLLDQISYLVLDEADEMLDMGFIDDIEKILENTNEDKIMLFFSATMPSAMMKIVKKFMHDYKVISLVSNDQTTALTEQIYFEVYEKDKLEALCRIIDIESEFYGIVFCRTKNDVDMVTRKINNRGYDSEALHGDVSQNQREKILKKFKDQEINVLVATDVAARGIDVNNLTHVINYSLPHNSEAYIHRIGRTGRAGNEGTAITFITPSEYKKLGFIKKKLKSDIRYAKVPEISDVIKTKKDRLVNSVLEELKNGDYDDYNSLSEKLLEYGDAKEILSAFIKYAFNHELSDSNYENIRDISTNPVDRSGTTRLFVALGKKDKMTPKKLICFINDNVSIASKKIKDIQIFDKFSFLTVPFREAELIIGAFKKQKRGKKALIELAGKRKKK